MGVVERLREEHLVEGLRGWQDAPRAGEVLPQRLPDQASEGDPPGPRRLGGPPLKVAWEKELRSMHV